MPGRDPGRLRRLRCVRRRRSRPAGRRPRRGRRRAAPPPITPRSSQPLGAPGSASTRAGTSAGSQPERPLGVGRVEAHLDQAVERRGRARGRRDPGRRPAWPGRRSAPRRRTPRRRPPCCSGGPPMKCQRTSRSANSAAFSTASWCRFSPTSRTPRSASSRTSEAGKNLVTTTRVISSVVAAGADAGACDALADRGQPVLDLVRRSRSCPHPDHPGQPAGTPPRRGGGSRGPRDSRVQRETSSTVTPARSSWARTPAPMSSAGVPQRGRRQRGRLVAGRPRAGAPRAPRSRSRRCAARPRPGPWWRRARASGRRRPPRRPRPVPLRPAWAAPTTPASGSASSTGTQSATRTISTTSGRSVTRASQLLARAAGLDDGVAVHLLHVGQRGAGGEVVEQQARGSRRRPRGRRSPTSARLSESKGTALTPSYLSVNARSTGPVLLRWAYTPTSGSRGRPARRR